MHAMADRVESVCGEISHGADPRNDNYRGPDRHDAGICQVSCNANLEELLESAWPSGVPREEAAIAAGLDDRHRLLARDRLRSLLAHEAGTADWQVAAGGAGLDRTSFFELAAAWRADRSLASIVPRVRAYRTTTRPRPAILEQVKVALKDEPDATRRRLAEIVRGRMTPPPGLTTIEGVIDEVRLDTERSELGGDAGFGRRVVVDVCPASMRILGVGDDAEHAVAWTGFVVDVATATVLAAAASCHSGEAMRVACLRAAIRVETFRSVSSAAPKLEVHPEGDAVELLRETRRLVELGFDAHPSTGRRSVPSRVSALLSRRFGPVTLKARLEVPSEPASAANSRMSDAEMMDARIDAEAERRWGRRVEDGLAPAVSTRRLAKALRAVVGGAAVDS